MKNNIANLYFYTLFIMKPFFGKELLRLYNNVNQEENYKKDNKDIMYYLYISFILFLSLKELEGCCVVAVFFHSHLSNLSS